jgi:hypothetical protein
VISLYVEQFRAEARGQCGRVQLELQALELLHEMFGLARPARVIAALRFAEAICRVPLWPPAELLEALVSWHSTGNLAARARLLRAVGEILAHSPGLLGEVTP